MAYIKFPTGYEPHLNEIMATALMKNEVTFQELGAEWAKMKQYFWSDQPPREVQEGSEAFRIFQVETNMWTKFVGPLESFPWAEVVGEEEEEGESVDGGGGGDLGGMGKEEMEMEEIGSGGNADAAAKMTGGSRIPAFPRRPTDARNGAIRDDLNSGHRSFEGLERSSRARSRSPAYERTQGQGQDHAEYRNRDHPHREDIRISRNEAPPQRKSVAEMGAAVREMVQREQMMINHMQILQQQNTALYQRNVELETQIQQFGSQQNVDVQPMEKWTMIRLKLSEAGRREGEEMVGKGEVEEPGEGEGDGEVKAEEKD